MPRGAKVSLALNEPNSTTTSTHDAPQVERNYCMQLNQWKTVGDQLTSKSFMKLK